MRRVFGSVTAEWRGVKRACAGGCDARWISKFGFGQKGLLGFANPNALDPLQPDVIRREAFNNYPTWERA